MGRLLPLGSQSAFLFPPVSCSHVIAKDPPQIIAVTLQSHHGGHSQAEGRPHGDLPPVWFRISRKRVQGQHLLPDGRDAFPPDLSASQPSQAPGRPPAPSCQVPSVPLLRPLDSTHRGAFDKCNPPSSSLVVAGTLRL